MDSLRLFEHAFALARDVTVFLPPVLAHTLPLPLGSWEHADRSVLHTSCPVLSLSHTAHGTGR